MSVIRVSCIHYDKTMTADIAASATTAKLACTPAEALDLALFLALLAAFEAAGAAAYAKLLVGSATEGDVGCVSMAPLPTITRVPFEGTPLTTIKRNAGPCMIHSVRALLLDKSIRTGARTLGLAGSGATCRVVLPLLVLREVAKLTLRVPMFIA